MPRGFIELVIRSRSLPSFGFRCGSLHGQSGFDDTNNPSCSPASSLQCRHQLRVLTSPEFGAWRLSWQLAKTSGILVDTVSPYHTPVVGAPVRRRWCGCNVWIFSHAGVEDGVNKCRAVEVARFFHRLCDTGCARTGLRHIQSMSVGAKF